ncbi:MAG: hypothetical protein E7324_08575 [Clostridiales bacterium]|nr:hypothetical protein [Clostridiales bacterium]
MKTELNSGVSQHITKRMISMALLLCLAISLAGCGADEDFNPRASTVTLKDRDGKTSHFTVSSYKRNGDVHCFTFTDRNNDRQRIYMDFTCKQNGSERGETYFSKFDIYWREGNYTEVYAVNFNSEGHDLFNHFYHYGGGLSPEWFWQCESEYLWFKASAFKEKAFTVDVDLRVPR